jgi:hypothetical protein
MYYYFLGRGAAEESQVAKHDDWTFFFMPPRLQGEAVLQAAGSRQ